MIHILFVPGSFGSALEWGVRTYSQEYEPLLNAVIFDDGSWHSFKKMFHANKKDKLLELEHIKDTKIITTTNYPMPDYSVKQIFDRIKQYHATDKTIIITISNMQDAELIFLMIYDKIVKGLYMGLDAFGDNVDSIKKWNSNYTSWRDMQPWEYREWLSGICVGYMQEWINGQSLADPTWLKIPITDILDNFLGTIQKIISYADLNYRHIETNLLTQWLEKQQKNINLLKLINKIVLAAVNKNDFTWEPMHVAAEALIQKKLKELGYNIKCYNLNEFPTNSLVLGSLLES